MHHLEGAQEVVGADVHAYASSDGCGSPGSLRGIDTSVVFIRWFQTIDCTLIAGSVLFDRGALFIHALFQPVLQILIHGESLDSLQLGIVLIREDSLLEHHVDFVVH